MHDPDVVAFTVPRPWPQRTSFPATGSRDDGRRWQMRLHHTHTGYCTGPDVPESERCKPGSNPFPWWRARSYSKFWRVAGRDIYWPPLITVWHREPGGADALTVCRSRYQDKHGRWHFSRGWHWHVHHWRFQLHPYQAARRFLLTRCAWCGGPSRKADPVNIGGSWHRPARHWWQGEADLFHEDCHSVERAHDRCLCDVPQALEHGDYGRCARCGRFRPFNYTPTPADVLMAQVPEGARLTPQARERVHALWAQERPAEQVN